MTTSQFLAIRGALVSASILIERDLARAATLQETRYIRRLAGKIDAGIRAIDSLEGERTDQPKPKEQLALIHLR